MNVWKSLWWTGEISKTIKIQCKQSNKKINGKNIAWYKQKQVIVGHKREKDISEMWIKDKHGGGLFALKEERNDWLLDWCPVDSKHIKKRADSLLKKRHQIEGLTCKICKSITESR